MAIPNIREVAEPYVKDIKDFWEIVCNPHPYPYDELTPEFTIERIQNNIEEWSEIIENKFLTMRRTPAQPVDIDELNDDLDKLLN